MKRISLTQGVTKFVIILLICLVGIVIGIEEYRIYKLNKPTVPCEGGVCAPFEDSKLYRIYGKDLKDSFDKLSLSQLKFGYAIGISGENLVIEDGNVVENPIPMCLELKEAERKRTQFDCMEKFNKLKIYSPEEYEEVRKLRANE